MGINEGINVFADEDGALPSPFYVPAYARRYPFILAKITPEASELSLCFDPSSDLVGDFAEGEALFEGADPSEACKATLNFRSEEHTSELQSLMRISYAVFCLKKKKKN